MVEIRHKITRQVLYRTDGNWLKEADLAGTSLRGAGLMHAWLEGARLRGADLSGADLRFANLHVAELEGARLVGANLYAAVMSGAKLRRADLEAADIQSGLLRGADLTEASLRHTDLRWSSLAGARLAGADLTGAALEGALLDEVRFDRATRWPDGFQPPGRPASLAPRGSGRFAGLRKAATRRIGRPAADTVRLWSIQEPTVWDRLQRDGVLSVDPNCIDPSYLLAYKWLRDQMDRRVPGYKGQYPWWAWHRPKPDLREWQGRSRYPGGLLVRLELAVPAELALLSDYVAWHGVLNGHYVSLTDAEGDAWDAEALMSGINQYLPPLPEPWNGWMRRSWERIFDLDALAAGGSWSTGFVQATFERLELAHVVAVTEFVTRPAARLK